MIFLEGESLTLKLNKTISDQGKRYRKIKTRAFTILSVFFRKYYANLHLHFICSFLSERVFNAREYFIC